MSGPTETPPALPGEVWRGVSRHTGRPVAITIRENGWPFCHTFADGRWHEHRSCDVYAAWALAERQRADRLDATLRALGVDP